jgi:hypothetical protein
MIKMANLDKANVNEIVNRAMLEKLGPQGWNLVRRVINQSNQQLQDERSPVIPNEPNSNKP